MNEDKITWSEDKPTCPLCGDWLSVERFLAKDTGEIIIEFTCLGAGDDKFDFLILTGLTNKDLKNLKEEGKIIRKEMKIKLLIRKHDSWTRRLATVDSFKRYTRASTWVIDGLLTRWGYILGDGPSKVALVMDPEKAKKSDYKELIELLETGTPVAEYLRIYISKVNHFRKVGRGRRTVLYRLGNLIVSGKSFKTALRTLGYLNIKVYQTREVSLSPEAVMLVNKHGEAVIIKPEDPKEHSNPLILDVPTL